MSVATLWLAVPPWAEQVRRLEAHVQDIALLHLAIITLALVVLTVFA